MVQAVDRDGSCVSVLTLMYGDFLYHPGFADNIECLYQVKCIGNNQLLKKKKTKDNSRDI